MTPGMVWSTTHGSRDDGMFWSCSTLTFVVVPIFLVSTTGDSPVTWTCRVTPATDIVIFNGTLPPVATTMLLLK